MTVAGNNLIVGFALFAVAIGGGGSGGGGFSTGIGSSSSSSSSSGSVADGYVEGAFVFFDVDGDQEYKNELLSFDNQMKELLGLSCSALTMAYPPGGYIEWHNNANAPSYNLVFTWSETGNGWFRYYDRDRKENVTIPDKAGWSVKAGYFGSYDDDKLVYHCAATECWRMTWSWMLGFDEEYWNDCLSVISEE